MLEANIIVYCDFILNGEEYKLDEERIRRFEYYMNEDEDIIELYECFGKTYSEYDNIKASKGGLCFYVNGVLEIDHFIDYEGEIDVNELDFNEVYCGWLALVLKQKDIIPYDVEIKPKSAELIKKEL